MKDDWTPYLKDPISKGAFRPTDLSEFFASFVWCCSPDISPTIHVANRQQHSTPFTRFTTSSNKKSFYRLLAGFNSTWSESRCFIYGKPNHSAGIKDPGFTRDGTSLESTTTYSRSSIWIMVAFSGTSIFSRTKFEDLLFRVGGPISLWGTNYKRCILTAERLFICLQQMMTPDPKEAIDLFPVFTSD
ncbi:hypothetical protein ILYODFUR_020635 [Ilyodon furcidens]|uniref:Uncharacterized protein n=1 Tax=Ilyodon furcidens TaxID=33524 RepID=A0ABV0UTQ5_9TELE